MGPDRFAELAARFDRVLVDVGTGDGKGAYAIAKRRPGTLVVGTDTAADNLRATAARAARKPARGGLANLLLVRAAAEGPPAELVGTADEIEVTLPWGRLLVGIVDATDPVLRGLAALGREGATYDITLNGEIWVANTPFDLATLPEATPQHVLGLADRYRAAGLAIERVVHLEEDELWSVDSTWARKLLSSRTTASFLRIRLRKLAPA